MTEAKQLQQLINPSMENKITERQPEYSLEDAESLIHKARKMTRGYVLESVTCILYNRGITCNALAEKIDRKNEANKRNSYFDEAIKCFQKAITNLEKVKTDFEKVEAKPSGELDEIRSMLGLAYHKLGYTYGNKKMYDKAKNYFEKSDEIFSQTGVDCQEKYKRERADLYRTFGFVYIKLGHHKEANENFSKALEIDPTLAYAHDSKGNHILRYFNDEKFKCDLGQGLKTALTDFQNAIDLFRIENSDKENKTLDIKYPLYSKGLAYHLLAKNQKDISEKQKNYDNAIECFTAASEFDIGFDYAWFNKGVSIFENSQLTNELWLRADGKATYDIKYSDMIIGTRYDEAVRCFDEVLRIKPNFTDAWYNKGVVLYYLRRYDEAVRCFDEILLNTKERKTPLKGKEIWSLFYKAKSSYFLGRGDKDNINNKSREAINFAKEAINEIVKCRENNIECDLSEPRLWLFIASCKILAKDCDEASKELEKINNGAFQQLQDDEKIQYYNIKGICSYEENQNNEALNWFKKAKEKADFNKSQFPPVTPYYNLAMLYHKQMNSDKARKTLEEYKNPEDSTIKEARMKIERQTGGGTGTDWYNWWFSRGKYKRAMGLMLLIALGIMLLPIPFAIVSHHMDTSANDDIERNIKSFEHAAYFGTVAIIVGILLMPNISKFKVGTGIEFEAAPQIIDTVNLDDPILKNPILSDDDKDLVEQHEMPIKYITQAGNAMPLKYQRRRLLMPINSIKMPVARGFIKVH
jgi:tetratricopeptide (TPR) repeat protein